MTEKITVDEPVRKNIRIPKDLSDWLDKESKRTAIPVSSLITLSVERYIEQKEGLANATHTAELLQRIIDQAEKAEKK